MRIILSFILLCGIVSCSSPSKLANKKQDAPVISLPEINISANEKAKSYQATVDRLHDLLHTKLDVRFSFEKQYLYGNAWLTLKPYFYPTNQLILDAKGFEIKAIKLIDDKKNEIPLTYTYDKKQVKIALNKTYDANETFTVWINYIAKPNELNEGGSEAIMSDKGLYFINPLGTDKNKPMQIWTQGETESSSCWFPTIDKPNERCTQEITITVPTKFKTLSNGILISQTNNADGTRSDYWKMDKPHAPYLFMMAIGEYAIVNDKWRNKDVQYYVEPEYANDAKSIFRHTPEMLEFFSQVLGVEYPWQKFSQVIVRDYVSGAMENTTAVIYGEFCQQTTRENIDQNPAEEVVAHEMFHHWFGDLVTCESWSNLTLNESFANYSEYLWLEHKYGREEADYHNFDDTKGYITQSQMRKHDLVDFYYDSREDMFDAHSYNKGGRILHMLRNTVGDKAFFASLKDYLNTYAYSSAEAHQLRQSFEKVTGRDLNWFFNQWYYNQGHPNLTYSYTYNESEKKLHIQIKQDSIKQTTAFTLPMKIAVHYGDNAVETKEISTSAFFETFTLAIPSKPKYVNFDVDKTILCNSNEPSKTSAEYAFQYSYADANFMERWNAIQYFRKRQNTDTNAFSTIYKALSDKNWRIRQKAVNEIALSKKDIVTKLKTIAQSDSKTLVRSAAIDKLADLKQKELLPFFHTFATDSSYAVIASAMNAIGSLDEREGYEFALKYKDDKSKTMQLEVMNIIANYANSDDFEFMDNRIRNASGMAFGELNNYFNYIKKIQNDEKIERGIYTLSYVAQNNEPWFLRNVAYSDLKNLHEQLVTLRKEESQKTRWDLIEKNLLLIENELVTIRKNEKNEKLKAIYTNEEN